ncbi:hypothetical protein D9613_004456 [Agrocybe pediades]|uniref:Uncharacterized protein n=1 Tax=Agrocybe pediades TaxID=84607 RepID=A0A8H4QIM0_9AGAR|nr:hypothetical protein D9613_004456 [Agrocybe pediades]
MFKPLSVWHLGNFDEFISCSRASDISFQTTNGTSSVACIVVSVISVDTLHFRIEKALASSGKELDCLHPNWTRPSFLFRRLNDTKLHLKVEE